jgi:hypothetical protein
MQSEDSFCVILAAYPRNSLKNAVASSIGIPLAPFDALRRVSPNLLLPSATKNFHTKIELDRALIAKDSEKRCT